MKLPETSLFRRAVYIMYILEKLIITYQEPIEGIKLGILLGYPSNILGYRSNILGYPSNILGYPSNIFEYLSKYCNYTSKRKLRWFPIPFTHQ